MSYYGYWDLGELIESRSYPAIGLVIQLLLVIRKLFSAPSEDSLSMQVFLLCLTLLGLSSKEDKSLGVDEDPFKFSCAI